MKTFLVILTFLFLFNKTSQSQRRHNFITRDSLLTMFQAMPPFEVLEKVSSSTFAYDSIRDDSVLKPYLMKWLDRKIYFQYNIYKQKENIEKTPDLIKEEILYILIKQNKEWALDSILEYKKLYKQYRDTAITNYINRIIKNNKKGIRYVPDAAIAFHSSFKFPESYSIIKKWWEESGKPSEGYFYFSLLAMRDKDAESLYNKKIEKFIASNGESNELMDIYAQLFGLNNSYGFSKLLETLVVDKNFIMLSEGDPGRPFNCAVIERLVDNLFYNSIQFDNRIKRNDTCKNYFKLLPEIKKAVKKLIKEKEEEEKSWMQNMPYYKENN